MQIKLNGSITHDGKLYTPGLYEAKDLPGQGKLFLSKAFNSGHYGPPTAEVLVVDANLKPGRIELAPDAKSVEARKLAQKSEAINKLAASGLLEGADKPKE